MKIITELLEKWRNLDGQTRIRSGYGLIALLVIALLWSLLTGKTAELERKRAAREGVLKELMPLKAAYRSAKSSADMLQGRLASVRPEESPAKVIEEIGIKGKGLKVTSAKGEERPGYMEDAVDVKIEGLTINEAINFVHKLEHGSRPVVVKKGNIRVRFDDPSRCDLTLVAALLKPAPGAPK